MGSSLLKARSCAGLPHTLTVLTSTPAGLDFRMWMKVGFGVSVEACFE